MGQIIFGKQPIQTDVPKRDKLVEVKRRQLEAEPTETRMRNFKESNEVIKAKWELGSAHRVPSYTFKDGKWQRFDGKESAEPLSEIRCLTYNVWFADNNKEERYPAIIQMIADSDAEFVCLQEVTHTFMHQYLLTSETIRRKYFVSGNTLPNYGVLILSKYPAKYFEVPLPSGMGRSLLICEPANMPAVATAHLESGSANSESRKT